MCQPAGIISQYQVVEMYLCNMARSLYSDTTLLSTIIKMSQLYLHLLRPLLTLKTLHHTKSLLIQILNIYHF